MMKDQELVRSYGEFRVGFPLVVGEFHFVGAIQDLHDGRSMPHGRRRVHVQLDLHAEFPLNMLTISVSHCPPGTSKWNKIEHRLFCHVTEHWRGRPLVDHETVVQLIGSVRTTTGRTVKAKLDTRAYPVGIKVPDAEMDTLLMTHATFHGDWNYTIHPRAANS